MEVLALPLSNSIFLIAIFSFGLSGCTTLKDIPVGTSRTPQVSGAEIGMTVGSGTTNTRTLYIAKDSERGSQRPSRPDQTPNIFFYERALSGHVYNIVGSLDFMERFAAFYDNGIGGVQYQYLGPTRSEEGGSKFVGSFVGGYTQVTKKADKLAMAADDSTAKGRQFSHIFHLNTI